MGVWSKEQQMQSLSMVYQSADQRSRSRGREGMRTLVVNSGEKLSLERNGLQDRQL